MVVDSMPFRRAYSSLGCFPCTSHHSISKDYQECILTTRSLLGTYCLVCWPPFAIGYCITVAGCRQQLYWNTLKEPGIIPNEQVEQDPTDGSVDVEELHAYCICNSSCSQHHGTTSANASVARGSRAGDGGFLVAF